jgi:hypothetical protein
MAGDTMKLNTGETGPEEFDAQREQLMIQDRRGDMMHRVPRDRRVVLPQWQHQGSLALSPVFAACGCHLLSTSRPRRHTLEPLSSAPGGTAVARGPGLSVELVE